MDIINKIDEAIKPSFDEWLNNRRNRKKIEKMFEKYYNEYASEIGEEMKYDDRYYDEEMAEEMDPIDIYQDFAHSQGFQAEYDAARSVIYRFKNEFDYQRKDEDDEEKQYELAKLVGYEPSFSYKGSKSYSFKGV